TAKAENLSDKMNENMSVLAYSKDLGEISTDNTTGYIMLGYDDIYSIQYFEKNLKGYWTNNGEVDIYQAFNKAVNEYSSIMKRCDEFNRSIMDDALKAGGKKYAELCALVYRQAVSAHKLVKDENGTLL